MDADSSGKRKLSRTPVDVLQSGRVTALESEWLVGNSLEVVAYFRRVSIYHVDRTAPGGQGIE